MRCPRCTLAELNETTQTCAQCGYSHTGGSPASLAAAVPTELDARRELAREFQIERLLEPGSQPIAYLARDAEGRALTLKAVPLTQLGLPPDRVLAALESAARLDHPHIIPVHDSGTTEHFLWYATDHVDGRPLTGSLGTVGPIELPVCVRMFEQIASAVEYAHRRGVTHGALRPDCILVDANERVLVGDFGTAGLIGPPPEAVGSAPDEREAADRRALARIAQLCLTGSATDNGSVTPRNGHRALPPHVSEALRRAMSVQASERYPSTLDFVAALGGTERTDQAATKRAEASTPPDAGPAWFSARPRKRPSGPMVIADSDVDPAASVWRKRVAAAAGVVLTLGAGVTWLGLSSTPPAFPSNPAPAAGSATAPTMTQPLGPRPQPTPPPRTQAPAASAQSTTPASVSSPVAAPTPQASTSLRPPSRTPAPAPVAPPVRTPAPVPAPVESHAEPALLSVNAIPWGSVLVDGRPIGNTPQIDVALAPGMHRLRVERDGFRAYERMIEVASGQRLRITDIALVER